MWQQVPLSTDHLAGLPFYVCSFCTFAQTLSNKKKYLETGDTVQLIKRCLATMSFISRTHVKKKKKKVWWHTLVTQYWQANGNLSREFKKREAQQLAALAALAEDPGAVQVSVPTRWLTTMHNSCSRGPHPIRHTSSAHNA
jgi:hypothetical protein